MDEPTFDELAKALDNVAQTQGIVGANSEARQHLRTLRAKKFTWIAKKENDLRFAIDRCLRGEDNG